jgi:hypothetical protein
MSISFIIQIDEFRFENFFRGLKDRLNKDLSSRGCEMDPVLFKLLRCSTDNISSRDVAQARSLNPVLVALLDEVEGRIIPVNLIGSI